MTDDKQRFESRAFLVLLAVATGLFGCLLFPFFDVVFWAVVIAVLFEPFNVFLRDRRGLHPNMASLLTILFCLLVMIVPLAWIFSSCAQEAAALYARLTAGTASLADTVDKLRETFPSVLKWLARYGYDAAYIKAQLRQMTLGAGKFIAANTVAFGGGAAHFLTSLALVLYIAFFLVRDGERFKALLILALPFGDEREKLLLRKFAEVMRATVKGSLLVAMVQGTLGGLIFWALDIHAPVMWGVVMTLLSLIPVVGAALVWAPAALLLLAAGHLWQGLILIAYGSCVIGLADNLLRPLLVGRDTKLPDFLILLSTLGGFIMFGMDGFVSGPTLAVLFVTVWQIFIDEREPLIAADNAPRVNSGANGHTLIRPKRANRRPRRLRAR
ncbi:MAG: AI-2E family transporter [Desulfovibrionaceae bacterium]|nr:AI-2E family transporter [Desulfovibrionaceae bacterium]